MKFKAMQIPFKLDRKLFLLSTVSYFFKKHFPMIFGLGLIAALGRVVQLGGFGAVPPWLHVILEIVVEASRILLFVYVLGWANVGNGLQRIKNFFTQKAQRNQHLTTAWQTGKKQWLAILLNLSGFLLMASLINYLIEALAYETCFYLFLKRDGILVATASEWTILLFFKNLSVIPLMLVFNALFLLWVTNKLTLGKAGYAQG